MSTRFEGNRFEYLARRALRSVESGLSQAKNLRIFVRSEMKHAKETPFPTKVAMWRRGFHSTSGAKYSLAARPHRDCVPDLPYILRGESLNGEYRVLLNDKLAFYHLLRGFD